VEAVAVAFSMAWLAAQVERKTGDSRAHGLLAAFRGALYRCFATHRDALWEMADAVLCKQDWVNMLAELSLEPEHRRGELRPVPLENRIGRWRAGFPCVRRRACIR
jgi:hypothetical protein